jgi:hypothetical protein
MYKCIKCNKVFKYNSKLNEHQSRKIDCNKIKTELKCIICKVNFNWPAEQERHNKSKKHINNINNVNIDNNIINIENKINYENKYNELLIEFDILKNNYENKYNELLIEFNMLKNNYNQSILKNNELLNENKLLKLNSNINLDHHEQIYIIHERTFVELNANIYKIGKTKNIKNRLNGYTKGSKLLFSIACKDCTESENKILNFLKNNEKYIHAKEYGNEYFQCNLQDLMSDIYNLILH